jgi:hypothetical protein
VPNVASRSVSSFGFYSTSSASTNVFDSTFGTMATTSESDHASTPASSVQVSMNHPSSATDFLDSLSVAPKPIPTLQNPHLHALSKTTTHGDCVASCSSTSDHHSIPTIDACLSKHMLPIWLNQYDACEETQTQSFQDGERQKALHLRCQRQFLLKFFNGVSNPLPL